MLPPVTIFVAVLIVCTIAVERCLALLKLFSISLEINEDYVKYVIFCAAVTRLLS